MKTGSEIGLNYIICTNKTGCDTVKELHYRLNDLMVRYQKQPLSKKAAERLLNTLMDIGKELKAAECPKSATDKKDEILIQLRTMCKSLKAYIASNPDVETDKHIRILKYRVARCLNNIENNIDSTEDILKMLQENKETYEDYYTDEVGEKYNIRVYIDLQNQLLDKLKDKYNIE